MVAAAGVPYGRPMTSPLSVAARAYRPVVSGTTWRATAKFCLDLPVTWISAMAVLVPAVVAVTTVLILPVSIAFALVALVANRLTASFDRYRLRTFLDLDLADPHRPAPKGIVKRFTHELRDGATWRSILYRITSLLSAAVAGALTWAVWCVPITALTAPVWIWALPDDRIDLGPLHVSGVPGAVLSVVVGLVLLPAAPPVIAFLAHAERRLGALHLGPRGEAVLTERIEQVESSRARVVDAGEVERRRIERDLHDGAQQRLVALALNLGMAKEKLATDPAAAAALIDEAHAESKRALVELRDLARGLHPAVLTDRGLGPALSAVAARSNVPIEVRVDLPDRPDPTTEGIAYFVVCEALANVAKHSGASTGRVTVVRRGTKLVVEVTDDGRGGATFDGSGLVGLRDRVLAVDGWLHVASPSGGPTTIHEELPSAS